ncbi:MAG: hypothetical protein WD226_00820 [Planctomycetota bacterium]
MSNYFAIAAAIVAPLLVATLASGMLGLAPALHLMLGLVTAIATVGAQTMVILFMIVTGRVLKAAMKSRPLGPEYLAELNQYFAQRSAYPIAVLAAFSIVAVAVLGYGRNLGLPWWVHPLLGIPAVLFNLWALQKGYQALRENQGLIDRTATELDRIDREAPESVDMSASGPEWRYGARTRLWVFACAAWGPLAYWTFVVWRGRFERVPLTFVIGTLVVSALGAYAAWRTAPDAAASAPES